MADDKSAGATIHEAFRERVIDPAKKASEAVRASGEKVAEGGATISTKLIDQAESNAREAFAAMRAAAAAKDLSEVLKVQSDYLRDQSSRNVAQVREISELIVQFGKEAVAPLKGG